MVLSRRWDPYSPHVAPEPALPSDESAETPVEPTRGRKPGPRRRAPNRKRRITPQDTR